MNKLHLGYAFAAALAGCNSGTTSQGAGDGGGDGGGSGMYARRLDLPVGAMPQSLAVTDADGDQRPDVLVARATGNGALTLLSANTAGLVTASLINGSIGDTPYALAVGDFDSDGMIDAAVANFLGGNVTALFGQSFVTKASFGDGAHPIALAVGDVNSDGRPDVLTANQVGNSVGVNLNQGGRMFAVRTDYPAGAAPGALLLAATDGARPSRLDIVVALPSLNTVRILPGQGGGSYSAAVFTDLAVGKSPTGLAMADLNADGNPDLVVVNRLDSTLSVLLGQAGGSFASAVSYPVGTEPMYLALSDLDGDGRLDAVVSNSGSATVSILRGQASGGLAVTDTVPVGMQPQAVVVTDIDSDGQKDILVGNNGSGTVTILFGKKL